MFAGEGGEWGCVVRAWAQANQTRRVALILLEHTETDKATHSISQLLHVSNDVTSPVSTVQEAV